MTKSVSAFRSFAWHGKGSHLGTNPIQRKGILYGDLTKHLQSTKFLLIARKRGEGHMDLIWGYNVSLHHGLVLQDLVVRKIVVGNKNFILQGPKKEIESWLVSNVMPIKTQSGYGVGITVWMDELAKSGAEEIKTAFAANFGGGASIFGLAVSHGANIMATDAVANTSAALVKQGVAATQTPGSVSIDTIYEKVRFGSFSRKVRVTIACGYVQPSREAAPKFRPESVQLPTPISTKIVASHIAGW